MSLRLFTLINILLLLITIIFFVFGLIIGSFLNVVIYRINTTKSLGGRSACMSCSSQLSWYELIPLFSFIALLGRCKNCKTKISFQYPLVEFATGFIFVALFLKFKDILILPARNAFSIADAGGAPFLFVVTYAYYAVISAVCIVIATYDIKHKIIPDKLAILLGLLSFTGLFFFAGNAFFIFSPHLPSLMQFLSGIIVALPFYLCWLMSHGRWMGLGDAKIAISLGWILGLSLALSGLVFAFWSGAIVGILLIIASRAKMKSEIPFAPYLFFGAFIAFVFNINLFFF